jgi:PAS domain S-box-containing protein
MNEHKEQEQELDRFFDMALDLLAVANTDGYLLRINKAWERCLGYSIEGMIGKNFLDFIHPDDVEATLEKIQQLRDQEPVHHYVNRYQTADGSYRSIEWQSQPFGNLIYAIGRDVTEARLAEQRLLESERHFRFLFEQSNDAVFMLDFEGRPILANQQARNMLGYTEEEFKTLTVRELSAEIEQSNIILQRLLAGEKIAPYECTLRHKDGSSIPAEITIELVRDEMGQPLHHQSIMRDITQRKKAEREAIELQLEKERMQVLSSFIHGTSHEFRTPLAIIKLNSYLMQRLDDPQQRAEKAKAIDIQIQRILDLLTMLNKMRQLDSHVAMKRRPCKILSLIKRIILNMQTEIDVKKLKVSIEVQDDIILGDEKYLEDAIWQIVRNAIQYSANAGEIRIRSFSQAERLCIVIEDDGIGMAETVLSHVFERFFRLDTAHTTAGFGLGLPLAQSIIQEHEGEIVVESKLGEGSRVEIWLPLSIQ